LADDTGPDDGGDPRRSHDRRTWAEFARKPGRKALQLCGQVRDAVSGVLAGCSDAVLRELTVVAVAPAPHSGRLLVTVAVGPTADVIDRPTALAHLSRAAGLIRRELAAAVSRRKVPELVFAVV
jgi:ribosome-binding factor A